MPQKTNTRLVDADGVVNPVTGGVGQAVDGQTIVAGYTVLLIHPPNGDSYAGPWVAAAGAWTRATDWDTTGDITPGDWWYIEQGAEFQGTTWHFEDTVAPTTLNTDPLTIGMFSRRRALEQGTGISISGTTPPVVTWTAPSDVQSTFIEGLKVEYLTANSIRIHAGACYIPTTGICTVDTDIDLTGLVLTASTWYYLYAYDAGGGVLAVDPPSTVAPVTIPYRSEARTKGPDVTPDSTRRLIGALFASATNTIRRFAPVGTDFVQWQVDLNSTLRAGNALTATVGADLDVSAFAPSYAEGIHVGIYFINSDNTSLFYITAAGDGLMTVGGSEAAGQLWAITAPAANMNRSQTAGRIAFAGSRTLRHRQTAAGASRSGNIDIMGYYRRLA